MIMNILKWYAIIYLLFNIIVSIYTFGKSKEQGILKTIILLIFHTPIIIYLFLN